MGSPSQIRSVRRGWDHLDEQRDEAGERRRDGDALAHRSERGAVREGGAEDDVWRRRRCAEHAERDGRRAVWEGRQEATLEAGREAGEDGDGEEEEDEEEGGETEAERDGLGGAGDEEDHARRPARQQHESSEALVRREHSYGVGSARPDVTLVCKGADGEAEGERAAHVGARSVGREESDRAAERAARDDRQPSGAVLHDPRHERRNHDAPHELRLVVGAGARAHGDRAGSDRRRREHRPHQRVPRARRDLRRARHVGAARSSS